MGRTGLVDNAGTVYVVFDISPASIFDFASASDAEGHAFLHLAFAVSFLLCSYNFFRAVTLDPGRAPKPSSESELRSVRRYFSIWGASSCPLQIIEELASTGRLNGMTFCVDCMVSYYDDAKTFLFMQTIISRLGSPCARSIAEFAIVVRHALTSELMFTNIRFAILMSYSQSLPLGLELWCVNISLQRYYGLRWLYPNSGSK